MVTELHKSVRDGLEIANTIVCDCAWISKIFSTLTGFDKNNTG